MSSHFFRCDPRVMFLDRSKITAGTNNFFFPSFSLEKLINAASSLRGLRKKFPTLATFCRNPLEYGYMSTHADIYVCAYIRTAITVLWLNRRIKSSRYLFRHDGSACSVSQPSVIFPHLPARCNNEI